MLYITYNNTNPVGIGTVYQRIIAIISLSSYLKIEYVHTPIEKLEHISSETEIQEIEEYFGFSKLYKNTTSKIYDKIIEIYRIDEITTIMELSKQNQNILLKTTILISIVEKYIYMYETTMLKVRTLINKNSVSLNYYKEFGKGKNVAVHIRRGDVTLKTTQSNILMRYSPTQYFKNIIVFLQKTDPTYRFYIFTELTVENKYEFDIFNNISNLEIISNNETLNTFHHLANADVLITCKSSFSYLSAFYNPNIIYYLPFWHKPFSYWKRLCI